MKLFWPRINVMQQINYILAALHQPTKITTVDFFIRGRRWWTVQKVLKSFKSTRFYSDWLHEKPDCNQLFRAAYFKNLENSNVFKKSKRTLNMQKWLLYSVTPSVISLW